MTDACAEMKVPSDVVDYGLCVVLAIRAVEELTSLIEETPSNAGYFRILCERRDYYRDLARKYRAYLEKD